MSPELNAFRQRIADLAIKQPNAYALEIVGLIMSMESSCMLQNGLNQAKVHLACLHADLRIPVLDLLALSRVSAFQDGNQGQRIY